MSTYSFGPCSDGLAHDDWWWFILIILNVFLGRPKNRCTIKTRGTAHVNL